MRRATMDLSPSVHFAASAAAGARVIVVPYPLQGHITPLMQLSKLMASQGLSVSFVTSRYCISKITSSKQSFSAHQIFPGIDLVGIDDGYGGSEDHDLMINPEKFLESLELLHLSFVKLLDRTVGEEGIRIACIISDSFLPWTQDVANQWSIPRICFWPNSLSVFSCSMSIPSLAVSSPALNPFNARVYETSNGEFVTSIPGIPEIRACMLPFHTLGGERSEAWMRHQIETQIQQINEYKAIIFNASPCLEPEVHACMKELLPSDKVFYTLGPLVPSSILSSESDDQGTGSSMFDEDEACVEWLDTQSPHSVLYISLGSLITFYDEAELQEFTSGLLDSKQPFLWVFRPSALLPTPRMECSFGKIIEWAPQLRVLAHNAVGGFLTHCGWNSTLESLLMGVPVLGWPQMLDQTTNCWFLTEKLKVGLRLESMQSKKVDHKSLENSIRRLMVGEEAKLFRARANEVRDMAKEACTQSSLSSVLESLVSTIVSLNHTK